MADADVKTTVPEVLEETVEKVENETQKEAEPKVEEAKESEPKENGDAVLNGEKKETNGVSKEDGAHKRKSNAGDAETPVEGTPEKKAKVTTAVSEESEESNSTNGSTEVAA